MHRCTATAFSLAAALAASSPATCSPHGPSPESLHSTATVSDPLSHGQLGDNLLSLNEAILLNQRVITRAELSVLELAQLQGFGEDIAWIDINASLVPKITFERDLDVINDQPHGLVIAGSGGVPVMDIGSTRGFVVDSNFVTFRTLILEGGTTAIDMTQPDALFGSLFDGCEFRGQTTSGISLRLAQDGGMTRVEINNCTFIDLPTAVEVFDTGSDRTGSFDVEHTEFRGGQAGVVIHAGPGGDLTLTVDRTALNGTTNGIVLDRPTPADTRRITVNALHVSSSSEVGTAFSFQGLATVADRLDLRMVDLGGRQAIRIWPLGNGAETVIEDSRFAGDLEVLAGATGPGIRLANLRVNDAALDVGSAGAPVVVSDSILKAVLVSTRGSTDVQIHAARFVGGSVQGSSSAMLDIDGSHMGATNVGPYASVTNPLPAPQLGSLDVAPLEPMLGGVVQLQADLPPNLSGFWFVGVAETIPILGPPPLHVYFFLSSYVSTPVPVRNQDVVPLRIPNQPILTGWDYVAQLAVLPDPGFGTAPPISLPPGRRFTIR